MAKVYIHHFSCSKKKYLRIKMSTCSKWRLNPLVNPATNRRIKRRGSIFKKLSKRCGSHDPTFDCAIWEHDTLVNPVTGRRIVRNGPTFTKLERECRPGSPSHSRRRSRSRSRSSSRSGRRRRRPSF